MSVLLLHSCPDNFPKIGKNWPPDVFDFGHFQGQVLTNFGFAGKPLTTTLLTSTFVFGSGGVPLSGLRTRVVFSGDFPGRVLCH